MHARIGSTRTLHMNLALPNGRHDLFQCALDGRPLGHVLARQPA